MRRIFRQISFLLNRRRLEQELEGEMAAHREMMAAERRRAFGNTLQLREQSRDAWGWTRVEQLARDVGYGMRQVRRNPAFSAIAIATLALGIGGITAIFSVFDAILIRPLPYADAGRLVSIWDDLKSERISKTFPTPAEWLEWRRLNTVFTDLATTQACVGGRRRRGVY
jgi:macrolide transport system ATP-binding/permease protein